MKEKWKSIPGYSDYEVSNLGRVKRVAVSPKENHGIILSTRMKNAYGYPLVKLNAKRTPLHQIVMLAFCGPPPQKHEINHKDGDKSNHVLDNLEYVTRQQNTQHAYDMGLISRAGSLNGRAKLTEQQVLKIRKLLKEGAKYKKIQEMFGISCSCVWNIKKEKNWKHIL